MQKNRNDLEKELVSDIAQFQHDPYGYVMYAFPWGSGPLQDKFPEDWQIELLKTIGKRLRDGSIKTTEGIFKYVGEAIQEARRSGHGIGKSALVAWIILWAISTFEDTRGVVTANTDKQLKTKTWPELTKWYNLCINKHWFTLTATAIFSRQKGHEKTWRIDAIPWSVNNTEAFAGLHNQGKRVILIFDEASAIENKIWEVAEGALTDAETEIIWLAFGNPTRNLGRFHDCFGNQRHLWGHKSIDSRTVRITNKVQIAKWVDYHGEDSDFVRVRVRGVEPHASVDQFISAQVVEAARGRGIKVHNYNFAPKIIGVDPKYSGNDEFAIVLRQGLMSWILGVYEKETDDDYKMAGIVARFEDEIGADAVFIDYGYGTGIHSMGKQMNRRWVLVPFGGASPDKAYLNKRAYMWGMMKKWLKEGGCIPNDEQLCADLTGPEGYVIATGKNAGKIYLESKEEMKAREVPSPNRADGLALTFAFPVMPKYEQNHHQDGYAQKLQLRNQQMVKEYDPFRER